MNNFKNIYENMPDGWVVKWTAQTNPLGYVWICNNHPMFSGNYEHGLIKIENLPERNGMKRDQLGIKCTDCYFCYDPYTKQECYAKHIHWARTIWNGDNE